ncbi:putative membrane protein [Escherichia phage YDC107_2]|nr:putative membrane protein [Escherichia phage YDC107_2]
MPTQPSVFAEGFCFYVFISIHSTPYFSAVQVTVLP